MNTKIGFVIKLLTFERNETFPACVSLLCLHSFPMLISVHIIQATLTHKYINLCVPDIEVLFHCVLMFFFFFCVSYSLWKHDSHTIQTRLLANYCSMVLSFVHQTTSFFQSKYFIDNLAFSLFNWKIVILLQFQCIYFFEVVAHEYLKKKMNLTFAFQQQQQLGNIKYIAIDIFQFELKISLLQAQF